MRSLPVLYIDCTKLAATMPVTACAARHVARHRVGHYGNVAPQYPTCASCPSGALRARVHGVQQERVPRAGKPWEVMSGGGWAE